MSLTATGGKPRRVGVEAGLVQDHGLEEKVGGDVAHRVTDFFFDRDCFVASAIVDLVSVVLLAAHVHFAVNTTFCKIFISR